MSKLLEVYIKVNGTIILYKKKILAEKKLITRYCVILGVTYVQNYWNILIIR